MLYDLQFSPDGKQLRFTARARDLGAFRKGGVGGTALVSRWTLHLDILGRYQKVTLLELNTRKWSQLATAVSEL